MQKSNGKLYWYGSGSVILDESDATGNVTNEYIFFGGKRLARRVVSSGQIQYYFADHLGSSRVITDASGNILDDADFYPFGGERTYTSTSGNAYKFTGKERDTESGLDDFGARYFTSQFGRFMTPDWSASPVLVPYADLGNPQTFNLYSYVANNPLNTIDPEGHFRLDPGTENYNDPDTGAPLYGEAVSPEQAKNQAQSTATQQNQSNEGSQTNLDKRKEIAKVATDKDGDRSYAQNEKKDDFGPGTNKCNKFVYDTTKEAGATEQVKGSDGKMRPALAGEIADKNVTIKNWRVLGSNEKPEPGDVVAYKIGNGGTPNATGHSGVVVGVDAQGARTMAAHYDGAGPADHQFASHTSNDVTYRRYTGP